MFEILNRAALMHIFPGSGTVLDGVVTDTLLVRRLANDARGWLRSKGTAIPAPLLDAARCAGPGRDIPLIAAVAGLAPAHGGWRWWDVIVPPVAA